MTPRPLPLALLAMLALLGVKLHSAWISPALVAPAAAQGPAPAAAPPPVTNPAAAPAPGIAPGAAPEAEAERALLEALRTRRAEIEARERALGDREMILTATERRIAARLEELQALQAKLEGEARGRDERAEQGWRQLVKTYETMRPRDAAAIMDDLDLPVAVPVLERMREAKVAPILAAMRPERARALTAELARARAPRD